MIQFNFSTVLLAISIAHLSLTNEIHMTNLTKSSQGNLLHRVRRIVGGRRRNINAAPYMVNIRKNGQFHCGGVVLTPGCILTAAHCVRDGVPKDFTVRAGVTYLDQLQNRRLVDNIFIPSAYNNRTLNYDVSIFKLRTPIPETNGISAIELNGVEKVEGGEVIEVFGWGLTNESAVQPSNQLRSVHLRVMEQEKCSILYKDFRNVTSTMFCASASERGDACIADSGGPAVVGDRLIGVVSWGRGPQCGRPESPGVYVNIANVRSWIETTLTDNCY